jgi:hypothetical protein
MRTFDKLVQHAFLSRQRRPVHDPHPALPDGRQSHFPHLLRLRLGRCPHRIIANSVIVNQYDGASPPRARGTDWACWKHPYI